MIIETIKKVIPHNLLNTFLAYRAFSNDVRRYKYHSNSFYFLNNKNKLCGLLIMKYHVIEKGLTMHETRLGFGEKVITELLDLCDTFIKKGYETENKVLRHSVLVLREYKRYHEEKSFELNNNIIQRINDLSLKLNILDYGMQKEFTKSEFFKQRDSSFENFCLSRHSSRDFTDEDIPISLLKHCINLANSSPSACNRQPTRVYIVKDIEKVRKILEIQNGNRGFGHLINTLLVVTSDVSFFQSINERNEPFFNAGLFSMTLAYALHFNEIGNCLLNWSASHEKDEMLRSVLDIPDNEIVTVLLACGYLPDHFKIASAPRLGVEEICIVV